MVLITADPNLEFFAAMIQDYTFFIIAEIEKLHYWGYFFFNNFILKVGLKTNLKKSNVFENFVFSKNAFYFFM